jgi:hypothetical protein
VLVESHVPRTGMLSGVDEQPRPGFRCHFSPGGGGRR